MNFMLKRLGLYKNVIEIIGDYLYHDNRKMWKNAHIFRYAPALFELKKRTEQIRRFTESISNQDGKAKMIGSIGIDAGQPPKQFIFRSTKWPENTRIWYHWCICTKRN